jgi:homocysteine S-methyltransferase
MKFPEIVAQAPLVLTEGAVIERLRRDPAVALDPHLLHAGLLYDPAGRERLGAIYRQYLEIGRASGLPMLLGTPTWRANPERAVAAGRVAEEVNREGAWFLRAILGEFGLYAERLFVGGLLGCRGDAYRATEALSAEEAARFHTPQAEALAEGGVDFLMGATLPACSEALGMARALGGTGLPYVLSFVLRPDGTLLDGTPLATAIAEIDDAALPPPAFYMANCVHPRTFGAAMRAAVGLHAGVRYRCIGLQGNSSELPPEVLEGLPEVDAMDPEQYAEAVAAIHREFGTRVLGGCCGTDDGHIAALARLLA